MVGGDGFFLAFGDFGLAIDNGEPCSLDPLMNEEVVVGRGLPKDGTLGFAWIPGLAGAN
jgi:hypothetical protein